MRTTAKQEVLKAKATHFWIEKKNEAIVYQTLDSVLTWLSSNRNDAVSWKKKNKTMKQSGKPSFFLHFVHFSSSSLAFLCVAPFLHMCTFLFR